MGRMKWNTNICVVALIYIMCIMLMAGCENDTAIDRHMESESKVDPVQRISDTEKPILIVTGEYLPYTSEHLDDQGFLTEMIKKTMAATGRAYEIRFYPWARCQEMVASGEAWASFPYGHSEYNDENFLFSEVIYKATHRYYYYDKNKKIGFATQKYSKILEFKDYILGGTSGYWYGEPKDFLDMGIQVEWAGDTDALVKMLRAKRIDFFIEDNLVFEEAVSRLYPKEVENFVSLPLEAKTQDYYLIVSKKYPDAEALKQAFNTVYSELVENGVLKEIVEANGIRP